MSTPDIQLGAKKRLARSVAITVSNYLKDAAHRAEFEKWYFETYGVQYEWKKPTTTIAT